ncbi:MAG TPA: hypothetical protein VGI92_03720 [Gemmatimonadales bacterium]
MKSRGGPGKKGLGSEPAAAARAASLRYSSDEHPGIRRRGMAGRFSYLSAKGRKLRDPATLARIRALVIPPAWTGVWISPDPDGHLQATGRDARGRKQYRYHRRWRGVRDETKYERMLLFGQALPRLRRRVRADLALDGLPREKVLGIVVRLLETTLIRVGNDEYARTNKSFGLTTLQDRHVKISGSRITFRFRGKAGKSHDIEICDRRMARLVRRVRDLPGQDLFQFENGDGRPQAISSGDVNDYLRDACDDEFTAKDFRTWAGTLIAARGLAAEHPDTVTGARAAALEAARRVAESLGNTVAVCRKSYIHPSILAAYEDEVLRASWSRGAERRAAAGLNREESALLRFLRGSAVRQVRRRRAA